ncbi:MAG: hypothetical protein GF383_08630 [Candidatus Lokiarchaeota archaeon]|nr:hypothetical protein [Candidatus Lokiarchaeota archaeon]
MLKIRQVKLSKKLPKKVKEVANKYEHSRIYKSEPMFGGVRSDYLVVLKPEVKAPNHAEYDCYGFVYNGKSPEHSEFGAFGLNLKKTERIW